MPRFPLPKPTARDPMLLASRARAMRFCPTHSEEKLFRALSAGRLGVSFRRQVPLAGRYIADLVAPAARLVVEVDGAYHDRRPAADARRDRVIERLGYRVLRVETELVERDLDAAVERVRAAIRGG